MTNTKIVVSEDRIIPIKDTPQYSYEIINGGGGGVNEDALIRNITLNELVFSIRYKLACVYSEDSN